jgi:hypothetical protein
VRRGEERLALCKAKTVHQFITRKMHTEYWWRNLTGDYMENLGVIGKIILKWFIGSRMGAG